MSTYYNLEKVLQELRDTTTTIIVEGKNDKKNLEKLGITNTITIHGPLQEFVATIQDKEAIILTDYDRRGQMLLKRLQELLQNEGITPNIQYRKKIRILTGINTYEELHQKYQEILDKEQGIPKRRNTNGKDLH